MKRIALLLLFVLLVGCVWGEEYAVILPEDDIKVLKEIIKERKDEKAQERSYLIPIPTPQPNNNAGIKQQYKIPR